MRGRNDGERSPSRGTVGRVLELGPLTTLRAAVIIVLAGVLTMAPAASARDVPRLSIQLGHILAVNSLAWSADGHWLLSGSEDNTARLWQVSSGALLRTFGGAARVRGVRNAVQGVALSADKATAVVGASDGVRAFRIAEELDPATLESPGQWVTALALDGSTVAVAGNGPADLGARPFLRLDDLTGGSPREVQIDNVQAFSSLSWIRDSHVLAVGGTEEGTAGSSPRGFVQLVDRDGGLGRRLPEEKPVEWLATPRGGDLFVMAGGRVTQRRGSSLATLKTYPARLAALSGDGRLIAIVPEYGTSPGTVATVEDTAVAGSDQQLDDPGEKVDRTRARVSSLAYDPTGEQLAVGFTNGRVAVWSTRERLWTRVWQPRAQGAFKSELVNEGGTRLAVADGAAVTTWDLRTGRSRLLLRDPTQDVTTVATSPDGALVATGAGNGSLTLWETTTGQMRWTTYVARGSVTALLFDREGRSLVSAGSDGLVRRVRIEDGQDHVLAEGLALPQALARTKDGQLLAVGDETGVVYLIQAGRRARSLPNPKDGVAIVLDMDFSPDGRKLAVAYGNGFNRVIVYDLPSGLSHVLAEHGSFATTVRFSPDGQRILSSGWDETARLWNANDGSLLKSFSLPGAAGAVGFTEAGRQLVTYAGEVVQFWRPDGSERLIDIVNAGRRGWAVVSPDGRFDTQELDDLSGFNWILPSKLDQPLSPELLMRDYFEPRLLSRMLACAGDAAGCGDTFRPVPDLADLNLVQPKVAVSLAQVGETEHELNVLVRVELAPTGGDAYDVRIFRDGQLVAQWPEDVSPASADLDGLDAWRAGHRVPIPKGETVASKSFRVRLPRVSSDRATRISAYAFNSSRIKSETARLEVPRSPVRVPSGGRAFVVAVGVSASDAPSRDLGFAAKDARDILDAVHEVQNRSVVPILLVSERDGKAPAGPFAVDRARKDDIRGVLKVLAGNEAERPALRQRLGPQLDALDRATPDDLVILAFSGHGFADSKGAFYLLPSDSGSAAEITPSQITNFISSEELASWLLPVDAGETALILDSCHAAGSVPDGFKPGPLGDRGLGQLAYDKGMRILAATQASDVAIENATLGQGLLTYALVQDGLNLSQKPLVGDGLRRERGTRRSSPLVDRVPADLNGDGEVTLSEWLAYGELRVPQLYKEIRNGTVRLRDSSAVASASALTSTFAQTPTLFDFSRERLLKVVIWQNQSSRRSDIPPPSDYWLRH